MPINAFDAASPAVDLPSDRKCEAATSSSSLTGHEDLQHGAKRLRSSSPTATADSTGNQVDWDSHYSTEGAARCQPTLRRIAMRYTGIPGTIGLHGGFPAAEAFPITSFSFTLRDGTAVSVTDPAKLEAMQQYSVAPLGYAPLQAWAAHHVEQQHAPPAPHTTCITTGSNFTLESLCSLLMEAGDAILCEQFTYSHIVESCINLRRYRAVPVLMDAAGMLPEALRATLAEAASKAAKGGPPAPRVLYTVPTGQNPTGSTVSMQRKGEIYAICCEYDVIILEDDPYYYLQYAAEGKAPRGLSSLEGSYLSLDRQGRVVRLDSFAKFLAPGLRLGWATGAPAIIQKLVSCIHGSALGPCSTSQVLVHEMLAAWGEEGLLRHVVDMQQAYAHRAAVVLAAADQHLKASRLIRLTQCIELQGLASWRAPQGGMFLWLALGAGVRDADEILDLLAAEGVVVVPGRICHALGPNPPMGCPFVRISFASASDADLTAAMARIGTVLRRFGKQQPKALNPPPAAAVAAEAASEPQPPPA